MSLENQFPEPPFEAIISNSSGTWGKYGGQHIIVEKLDLQNDAVRAHFCGDMTPATRGYRGSFGVPAALVCPVKRTLDEIIEKARGELP